MLKKYGKELADSIEWPSPRLLCIAGDFTKYDEHAVQQINRNVELLRYVRFGTDLLLLELVNAVVASTQVSDKSATNAGKPKSKYKHKTISEQLAQASADLIDLYEALKATLFGFGDDVQEKILKLYIAFKRIKNFASVEVLANQSQLRVFVKVDPSSIALEPGFTRDVREIGHWGTGDLEITIRNLEDLAKAKPLLEKSYERS